MTYLKLCGCSLGPLGADSLARTVLAEHKGLVVVDLSRNALGVAGAKHVASALVGNSTLRRLDLSHNDLGPGGAAAVAACLPDNSGLRELCLDGNGLELSGALQVWLKLVALLFIQITDAPTLKVCAGLREGQALVSLSLVDDTLTAAHAVMVAQELSGLPLELLLLGPSDDHLTMVGAESLAAFWDAPLSFSVRHRFKSSALALIAARNSEANQRGGDDDDEDNTEAHCPY